MIRLSILFCLCASLLSFRTPPHNVVLVIQQCPSDFHRTSGDTIFIQYCIQPNPDLNDSIVKYCGSDTSSIQTIMICNAENVMRPMNFKRFSNLSHLILAGDDVSYLDSVRYDFFNNPNLKRITLSSVCLSSGPEYGKEQRKSMQHYIHAERKDIKVRFKPMGKYNPAIGFG